MKILLISTYELGRQPFGLASPAAWLRKRGHKVTCLDLSRQALSEQVVLEAGLIAFYVPMHTATRLTLELLEPIRRSNPGAHLCAYGLYAPLAAESLRAAGVESLLRCWVRETSLGPPEDGMLYVLFPAAGTTLRVPVRHWSAVGQDAAELVKLRRAD